MKLIFKLAKPQNQKEQLFRLEFPVNDLKNPGESHINLEGKEYLVEIHFDT